MKAKRFHDHWLPLSDEDEEGVWRHYETGEVKFLFSCRGRQKRGQDRIIEIVVKYLHIN